MRHNNKPWTNNFKWLVEMTQDIGKGVKFVAWGQSWSLFFEVSKDLEKDSETAFKMKRPASFSETKFADHAHEVYDKFRNNYQSMVLTLEKVKENFREGVSSERQKSIDADYVQGRMYNWTFALSLSAVTDVYKVYRMISCILQKINILPHEKLDKFQELVTKMKEMKDNLEISDCPCCIFTNSNYQLEEFFGDVSTKGIVEEICFWPRFHNDVREAKQHKTYMNTKMGMVTQEQKATRAGVEENNMSLSIDLDKVIKTVEKRAQTLSSFLSNGLSERVYSNNEIILISHCRRLLDLESIMNQVVDRGHVNVSSITFRRFKEAAIFLEPNLTTRLDDDELRPQFRLFHAKLEEMSHQWKETDKVESLAILGKFFDPALDYYK